MGDGAKLENRCIKCTARQKRGMCHLHKYIFSNPTVIFKQMAFYVHFGFFWQRIRRICPGS